VARTEDRTDTPNENLRDSGSQTDLTRIQGLPREKPIEVLESPTAPDYAKVQAAKELSRQLKEGDQGPTRLGVGPCRSAPITRVRISWTCAGFGFRRAR
jgi:hypothetical protein